jgi:hypothetical protein
LGRRSVIMYATSVWQGLISMAGINQCTHSMAGVSQHGSD